jgi:hypothetical protein
MEIRREEKHHELGVKIEWRESNDFTYSCFFLHFLVMVSVVKWTLHIIEGHVKIQWGLGGRIVTFVYFIIVMKLPLWQVKQLF